MKDQEKKRTPHGKLKQGKEDGGKKRNGEQKEINRLENMRKEIDRTQKELARDLQTLKEKRENQRGGKCMKKKQSDSKNSAENWKRYSANEIGKRTHKATPPPAPETNFKAPPTNLVEHPPKSPTKSALLSQEEEESRC